MIPADFEGRSHVSQWCFAALTTVERAMMEIQLIDKFGDESAAERRRQMVMLDVEFDLNVGMPLSANQR